MGQTWKKKVHQGEYVCILCNRCLATMILLKSNKENTWRPDLCWACLVKRGVSQDLIVRMNWIAAAHARKLGEPCPREDQCLDWGLLREDLLNTILRPKKTPI